MRYIFLFLMCFVIACSPGSEQQHEHSHDQSGKSVYTCPMHPEVRSETPGKCPVCGMDLVEANSSANVDAELMLSDSQIKLANITTQIVTTQSVGQQLAVNAVIRADESKTIITSARFPGRIEKLYYRETGRLVNEGTPLFDLYSEALLTLQQEYLLAKEQFESLGKDNPQYQRILDGAYRKLILYGLTEKQIRGMKKENLKATVTFYAPTSGIIRELNITEGQYISEGSQLFKLENLNSLWVEAELYPKEATLVHVGDVVQIRVNNENIPAKINYISAATQSGTQVTTVRASITNTKKQFSPGESAQLYISYARKKSLALSVDAVIRDGKGTHVYRQTALNTFRPVLVSTGTENVHVVEITSGLHEGDTIVTTGAYLLYSEYILKKGMHPLAGHQH